MESSEIVAFIFVLFDLVSFELALYTLVRYKNAVFPLYKYIFLHVHLIWWNTLLISNISHFKLNVTSIASCI